MVGLINNWLERANKVESATVPNWLVVKRNNAIKHLQSLADPDRKLEFWRYADANRIEYSIENNGLQKPEIGDDLETDQNPVIIRISEQGFELFGDRPSWLEIGSVYDIDESHWLDLNFDQETVVNLSNTALFSYGISIKMKANDSPINLLIEYQFSDNNQWQYVRNQISLAENCQVNVEEKLISGRVNIVNVYEVNNNAKLQRKQNVLLNKDEQFISFNQFEVSNKAEVVNMSQHIGGSLQHHLHRVNFNSNESLFKHGSINKSFDNNQISDLIEVNHHQKNNKSEVTHRSIAKDQSQIFNNAKAMVAPGADQSEIEQDLKNILLSEDAKIFSKPELEVYADEVVAAHGSTIGALDEQSLFYLQSRGIDIEQARDIMIESFEQEAVIC